jgi:beta-galactosidase
MIGRTGFNDGWAVSGADGRRSDVTLPHDAMIHERRDPKGRNRTTSGYFPGGRYTYRKTFEAPAAWAGQHVSLHFEGIYHRSAVRLNGRLVGGRPSGYAGFDVDLGEHLNIGAANELEVVADTADAPNGRWYTGSGMYRPVWLRVQGRTHLAPDGVRFRTTSIDGSARTEVEIVLAGEPSSTVDIEVQLARTGVVVATGSAPASGPGSTVICLDVDAPALWSEFAPNLYDLRVELRSAGALLDIHGERVGIRTITADARRGLVVNGAETLLRGGCIHHDNGVLGAATFRAAEHRRVRILKELGFNAIRSAHNPISRDLLDACDELGVYVLDELTDVWTRPKTPHDYHLDFTDWWERDLEAMVAKDRNHPSVLFYSLGNEIAETQTAAGVALGATMVARCRELDPTRLITNCINLFLNGLDSLGVDLFEKLQETSSLDTAQKNKRNKRAKRTTSGPPLVGSTLVNYVMWHVSDRILQLPNLPRVDRASRDIFEPLDVAGYNYGAGQYRLHSERHPDRVIVGSETSPAHLARNWRLVEELPNVIGDFMWTAWDYLGEVGIGCWTYEPERSSMMKPYPYLLAGTGVVDIIGEPGAGAKLAQAVWGWTTPSIVVRPLNRIGLKTARSAWRGTDAIASWTWPGFEGIETDVIIYSAAEEIELLVNGTSCGRRQAGRDHGCQSTYRLPYEPGTLEAIARDHAGREVGRSTLTSAGDDVRLRLRAEQRSLGADGQDLAFVNVELADENGIVVPISGVSLSATVTGAASIAGFGSADPKPADSFVNGLSHTHDGRALAVVRAGYQPGDVTLSVTSDGFGAASVPIAVEAT